MHRGLVTRIGFLGVLTLLGGTLACNGGGHAVGYYPPIGPDDSGVDGAADSGIDAPADSGIDAAADSDVDAAPDAVADAAPATFSITGSSATTVQGNSSGGTAYPDACPSGQALIGLDVTYSGSMQQIGAVCAPVILPAGTGPVTTGAENPLTLEGVAGSTQGSLRCPANSVVVGFGGNSGLLIDSLSLVCAPLDVTSTSPYTFAVGTTTTTATVGGSGGSPFAETDCPQGEVAFEAYIRAGNSIDGFGVVCGAPSAM